MRWFRQNMRFATSLALFAMAMHLALTFGHMHPENPSGSPASLASSAVVAASSNAAAPELPGDRSKTTDVIDCAICANINLAGALVAGTAPSLAIPVDFRAARPGEASEFKPSGPARTVFDARGPPLV